MAEALSYDPPQYHDRASTARVMWTTVAALVPAALWGIVQFGAPALGVLTAAVVTAVVAESIVARALRRRTLHDGSAVVAGLMVGMALPPGAPLVVPVAASAFAMLVVKWTFGGLGANWMNPALAGWSFAFFSWPAAMQSWITPAARLPASAGPADAVGGATPLAIVAAERAAGAGGLGPLALLRRAGYTVTELDTAVTEWLNASALGRLGVNLPAGYVDLFLGRMPGSIGEISAALLLAGSIVLIGTRIVRWYVPASYFATFALGTWIFGGIAYGQGAFAGDVLFATLTGSVVLVIFFMATDPVTSPITRAGMLLYGAGAGVLTVLLRAWSGFPESTALAVLLMNTLVPAINRATQPRRFGTARTGSRR